MLKHKFIGLLIYMYTLLNNVPVDNTAFDRIKSDFSIQRAGKTILRESSGLALADSSAYYWTHADSGNEAALYLINDKGDLLDTLSLPFLKNIDWEDITRDELGNFYIGDFGNNSNARKNLVIHKLNAQGEFMGSIHFNYVDQKDFPPKKRKMNFDCEAFFWADGRLHLFSKNRGEKCVKHYAIPDVPGTYEAQPLSSIYLRAAITGADVDMASSQFVLLGYGRLYFFDWHSAEKIFEKPKGKISFKRSGTAEGIVFADENKLLISNESGNLWQLKRK
jgi:hypothetical protein